jgi:hypothetical protein
MSEDALCTEEDDACDYDVRMTKIHELMEVIRAKVACVQNDAHKIMEEEHVPFPNVKCYDVASLPTALSTLLGMLKREMCNCTMEAVAFMCSEMAIFYSDPTRYRWTKEMGPYADALFYMLTITPYASGQDEMADEITQLKCDFPWLTLVTQTDGQYSEYEKTANRLHALFEHYVDYNGGHYVFEGRLLINLYEMAWVLGEMRYNLDFLHRDSENETVTNEVGVWSEYYEDATDVSNRESALLKMRDAFQKYEHFEKTDSLTNRIGCLVARLGNIMAITDAVKVSPVIFIFHNEDGMNVSEPPNKRIKIQ